MTTVSPLRPAAVLAPEGRPIRRPSGARTGEALTIDGLVDATPATRDRVVDFMRALSIAVVVLWHWTFSVTHWRDGALRMPNPIGDVPGLWAATWLLQVMPLFFLVGGYANLATWTALGRGGVSASSWERARRFWAKRFARLVRPVAVYVACWTVVDLAWQAGGGRSVRDWGLVVFVPLWFLGVYVAVVTLVPLTARAHAAHPAGTLAALAAGIVAADVARLGAGVDALALDLAGSALVWVFCHQLGYLWRDWTMPPATSAPPVGPARPGGVDPTASRSPVAGGVDGRGTGAPGPAMRRRGGGVALVGLVALIVLTQVGPYSASMVTVRGEVVGNMFPTTVCIAGLALVQLGIVLLVRDGLHRWLRRRRVWRAVVAANAVAMTVFCWHMTALVGFLLTYEAVGFGLPSQPTAGWWLSRPVWLAGPALLLAVLVAIFGRFETRRSSGRAEAVVDVAARGARL